MQTKIVLIPICTKLPVSSDGTATPVLLTLDVPKFRHILPYANSLVLITLTEGMPGSNELEISVQFRSGFDRDHELTGPVALQAAPVSTNASVRHAAISSSSSFQLESRLELVVQNKTGISGVRTGVLSAVIRVELVA